MCWRRYTINLALDVNGAKLSDEMLTSLDAFEEVISESPHTMDFLMREGELLFSDNTRTIHARTPIAAGTVSDRLMIRSWINAS
jgi:alpha-ketoglutarate-dependent taurine dioxygenase